MSYFAPKLAWPHNSEHILIIFLNFEQLKGPRDT